MMTDTSSLTPEQLDLVEERLAEHFVFAQDEVGAQLGLKRQPNGGWSEADANAIIAEIDRIWRPRYIALIEQDPPASASSDPAIQE